MRNGVSGIDSLSKITLEELSKDEKLIECVLTLLRKMLTLFIIVNFPKLKSKNHQKLIEKVNGLLAVNITLGNEEIMKGYLQVLELEIDVKATFHKIKAYLCITNSEQEFEIDPDSIKKDFEKDWLTAIEQQQQLISKNIVIDDNDIKMDEENIEKPVEETKIIDELTTKDNLLTTALKNKTISIEDYLFFKCSKYPTVSFVEIEPVYFDFYQNNLHRKCDMCNDYPKKTDLVLCLLCKSLFCLMHCRTYNDQEVNAPGNIAKHAYECHAGVCVLVNVMNGQFMITEHGRYSYGGNAYSDSFGNGVKELSSNVFSEKQVDQKTLKID